MKKKSDTTIVAGTEMDKGDVKYLLPLVLLILGVIVYFDSDRFVGFVMSFIGLLLLLIMFLDSKIKR